MKGAPRSKQFDDVYFSADDGLAETRHVFLDGNGLPDFWNNKDPFVIGETGFGTGLNFLAVWDLMDKTARIEPVHFLSFEMFPLSKDEILGSLEPWRHEFGQKIDALVERYPEKPEAHFKADLDENLSLEIHFDDVNEIIPKLETKIDCWFLDGFTPAKNPAMWSNTVFQNMARLSNKGARFATFTAAGFVRRGLEDAGFTVEKRKGFGRKRDMICGQLNEKN